MHIDKKINDAICKRVIRRRKITFDYNLDFDDMTIRITYSHN